MYRRFVKRVFDVILALVLIIAFSPIFLLISLVNAIINGGSVFFVQTRVGQNEQLFKLYKFKTMQQVDGGEAGDIFDVVTNSPMKVNGWGRFLRKSGLDELPQLINVLENKISMVGPRPLLPEYINYFSKEQRKRHQVKPGITGLAQTRGRNRIDWDLRLKHDLSYVQNVSWKMDLQILWDTGLMVINPGEMVMSPSFIDYREGSNSQKVRN